MPGLYFQREIQVPERRLALNSLQVAPSFLRKSYDPLNPQPLTRAGSRACLERACESKPVMVLHTSNKEAKQTGTALSWSLCSLTCSAAPYPES